MDVKRIGTAALALALLAGLALQAGAADKVWNPTSGTGWNTEANWSPSGVPGSGDRAIFDGNTNSANCALDAAVNVAGVLITNAYSGTITQSADITVGASGWMQAGGAFAGGSQAFVVNGPFSLSGDAFTGTSGTMTMRGNWNHTGGTFSHNNGTVAFDTWSGGTYSIAVPSTETFYNLTVSCWTKLTLELNANTLVVLGTFTHSATANFSNPVILNNGTIEARGNVVASSVNSLDWKAYSGGTATLVMKGTADQNLTSSLGHLCNLAVDKPSGTVTCSGELIIGSFTLTSGTFTSTPGKMWVKGNWSHTAGTFNHNNGTVEFHRYSRASAYSISVPTTETFYNLSVSSWEDLALNLNGNTLVVLGTFANNGGVNGSNPDKFDNGTLELRGNMVIAVNTAAGTAAVKVTGSGNQTYTTSGGVPPGGTWTVDKSGGALSLLKDLSLTAAGQQLVWTNGAVDLSSSALTVGGMTIHDGATALRVTVADTNKAGRLVAGSAIAGLGNVALDASLGPGAPPAVTFHSYTILRNVGTNAQTETFQALPEGASVLLGPSWTAKITYAGNADGGAVSNDVVLYDLRENADLPYAATFDATNVAETSAWLNGRVVSTGLSETVVWVYWGETSGGTNAGAWAASTNLGTVVLSLPADYTFEATNLVAGRTYYCRYYVENSAGGSWGIPERSFRTFGPPAVDNAGGATALRGTSATLNGTAWAGRPTPDVWICWGTSDAGMASTGAWAHVESLGALDGAFARAIGGLTPGQTYFYRCFATNSYGLDWADTAASFTTAAYDDFAWRGLGADNNWSTPANWAPSSGAPTQAWDRTFFDAAAPRQPTVDRGLALTTVQVSGTNSWTWGGSAAVSLSQALDYGSSGVSTWSPALAGAGGVTVSAGQLTLGNTNNAYTGATWIKGGQLLAAGRMGAGVANVLGAAVTPIRLGDTNGAADAILSFTNGGVAVVHDRAITVEAGSTGRAVLWSQPGAGGQTLAGALALGKDTEFRTEGGSALTLGTNPSGVGALVKSGAQALLYPRADSPGHTGGTSVQSGLLQWGYTQGTGEDATLRFGGGAGLLTLDGGQFEFKATETLGLARLTLDNPVRVTTNGGALYAWQSVAVCTLSGGVDLAGPLTIGSLAVGSAGNLTYRGAITLDQSVAGVRALRLNHTGSDVVLSSMIADGVGANALPLQVGIVFGGATATPFRLAGTNATYAGGTVFTGGRVTLTNPKAVGPGPLTVWSNGICHLARTGGATNWAFAQNLSGSGVVQVEDGTNAYQLLSQGATVSPGVGAGDVGRLTIAGRCAFATNAVGQASRLSIDVACTNSAADARADLLRVDYGDAALAASLAQCDLVVNLALPPGVSELQRTFTILTNTYDKASFTNQTFRSVTFNGGPAGAATVRYATGYVALDVDIKPVPTGAVLIVR